MATKFAPDRTTKTGVLIDPSKGFGSAFAGDGMLPRSLASDGRRWVLTLHVLVHLAAIAFSVMACIELWDTFPQKQMKASSVVAASMHGVGVLCLLALAASEVKQIAFVVSVAFIYAFLFTGLVSSIVILAFTFRSDDVVTDSFWMYYVSTFLQTLGLSFVTACGLNMAANGDVAFSTTAETAPLAAP